MIEILKLFLGYLGALFLALTLGQLLLQRELPDIGRKL